MRLMASVVLGSACLLSACTSSPTTSTPVQNTAAPSSAPASIQILASTRPDSQLDVTAKVLTAQGTFVANATVAFAVDNGSVTPPTAMTDVNGLAHTIVTSSGKVTITASVGSITASTATTGTVATLTVSISVPAVQIGTASAFAAGVSGLAPGATVTSYAWDFGDANTAQTTTSSTTHLYAAVGSYNASVKVIDSLGRSATSLAVAVVSAVPVPPSPAPPPPPSYTVVLTASPTTVVIGASSTLTAMVTLLNGAPAPTSYAWDCDGNGTTDFTTAININTQPCAYPLAGTITSKVTVTGGSVTGTASTSVTVTAPPLFVAISPSTSTPTVGVNLDFTATVTSVGPLPALMQWQWDDTNDGTFDVVVPSAANGNVRTTNYGATGAVTIKVLVTDVATGRTAIGTRTVTVQ